MKNIQIKKLLLVFCSIFAFAIFIAANAFAQAATDVIETFTTQSPVKRVKESAEAIRARKAAIAEKLNVSVPVNSSEIISLPQLDYEKIIKEDKQNQGYQKELRIGVHRTIEQSFDQNWRIFSRNDGKHSWRVVIYTSGAGSIRPHFKRFPSAGSEVYLYGKDGIDTLEGPVKKPDVYEADEFWGPVIKGDYLYIEVVQDSASEHPDLYIDTISHRYRDPISGAVNDSNLKESNLMTKAGSCELDIKCYSSWVTYGKGIAEMEFEKNGSYFCTGSLIMDQSATYRNWFLTANHCISSNTVANTLVASFGYTTPWCDGLIGWSDFKVTGATFKTGSSSSDFSLLELAGDYPISDTTYLGWTTSNLSSGASVTGIHHPDGSYQRISFGKGYDYSSDFTITGILYTGILYKGEDFWDVLWTSGTTEEGSSGSPLLNSNKQIVGQLLGGAASCTVTGPDHYGKFGASWNAALSALSAPSCTYSISPTSKLFTSSAGTGSVTVTPSSSSCTWTATESLDWVSITSGSSGTGSGTVSYSVSANTSTSSRSGNMTIAGQTFTIIQSGASCTYTISPTSQSFTSSAGTGSVTVTPSSSSCTWTATESLDWVSITSGASGTGSGTVSYSVSANTSTSSRSGNMTIAGQTFTITQSAASTPAATKYPVYRFASDHDHFFTISESEKSSIMQNLSSYTYEGVAFYAYQTQQTGTSPVYRFASDHDHFFTISESEKSSIMQNLSSYTYEGVAFYAYQAQ